MAEQGAHGTKNKRREPGNKWGSVKPTRELEVKSVLFVEQSPGGELAKRMRDVLRNMEPTMGFRVKVAERTGRSLGSQFPLTKLWEGAQCGREECVTCLQECEEKPQCTLKNLVYENICLACNPGASKKGELMEVKEGAPTLYIGETSRSIYERSREHWEGARRKDPKNHMVKHQTMEHGGEQEPKFTMKVFKHYKTALGRQVAEAVRIRRRGGEGAILNSRGEFNRSHIPRLQIEDKEPEGAAESRKKDREQNRKVLKEQDKNWEEDRAREMGVNGRMGATASPSKRRMLEQELQTEGAAPSKRRKRRKHEVLSEDWGELGAIPNYKMEEPREPQDMEPLGSTIPREQALRQLSITGFYNPAPTTPGRPTSDDLVANIPGGNSTEDMSFVETGTGGRGGGDKEEYISSNTRGTLKKLEKPEVTIEEGGGGSVEHSEQLSVTPSINQIQKQGDSRDDGVIPNKNECTFKRGKCEIHNVKGTRIVNTKKTWGKLKNGMHGWKYAKLTTYKCEGGMTSKVEKCETGMATKVDAIIPKGKISLHTNRLTDSVRSGGNYKTVLEHSGISGEDNRGAEADESDSSGEIRRVKGND